ncbi:MAG: adenylate kinase [Candidatus Latescibacter sp.]|nr:adenylate kinase [Candidatus Latescibacter sp.]
MKLILLGGPGAGKGTQAAKLKEFFGIPHISTGEILREARAKGTDLGRKAAEYMDAGKLLPDDVILGIIEGKMKTLPDGFLFDGFPRTIPQSEGLDRLLEKQGKSLDGVISVEVPDEVVLSRLLKRATIEGRSDDNRETIENRHRIYYQQTEPLKSYYRKRGILKVVDGLGTVEEVFVRIKAVLE